MSDGRIERQPEPGQDAGPAPDGAFGLDRPEAPQQRQQDPIRQGDKRDELLVFDHGFVRLDDCMADDLSVVNAARVSFAVRKETMDERDEGLIRFLMRNSHGTPYEHNSFRFHIRAPIFVAREWFRHRIGSFNEESARYHTLQSDFYVPAPDAVRTQVGKPGAYSFEPLDDATADEAIAVFRRVYRQLYEEYRSLIEKGVAKEFARAVLPFGIYT